MIKHPSYKGVWAAKRIENPAFYEVTDPVQDLAPIGAVALEVWVHKPQGIMFDNILVVDDYTKAYDFGVATWKVRVDNEKSKNKAVEDARKAAERKKKLEQGGFFIMMEEYTKMTAEAFAAYPFISFPAMLALFFLIFKYCRGGSDEPEPKGPPRRAAPRPTEAKAAEKEVEKDENLRQRKGTKEAKEETTETEETEKDK